MRAGVTAGSLRESNVEIAVDGARVICKWTVEEAELEATLVVVVGNAHIQGSCVHISAKGAPTLRLRPLSESHGTFVDCELPAKMRKEWIAAVKENSGLKLHCTVDAAGKLGKTAALGDVFASLPKATVPAPSPQNKRTAPAATGREATHDGEGRSPKRARGGRSRDGTLVLPPPPETPKVDFAPVKPLTQTEMAEIGLGGVWEKTNQEANIINERSPEFDSIYEELGIQKKQLFW
jgi:hypothetical protein